MTGQFGLRLPLARVAHGGHVHGAADVYGTLHFGHFFGAFVRALGHNGADQGFGSSAFLFRQRDVQGVFQQQHVVVAVRRREVDRLPCPPRFFQKRRQPAEWQHLAHARTGSEVFHGGHGAHPYDVFETQIVAENDLAPGIDVDYGGQPWFVDPEKIQEIAVLPEMIGIARVVHTYLVVAGEQQQAGFQVFFEAVAAGSVNVC